MKVVVLLSGGKDSVLAMMMAVRHGHVPVVVANLQPLPPAVAGGSDEAGRDDLDSYCFQTVGHEAVAAIAECLELPIRRAAITRGQSIDQTLDYTAPRQSADEVETLFQLLRSIQQEFPEVEGVTSGAILSVYQRNRVEHVCECLGLVSVAYLWQRPGNEILDMCAALAVDAILVKTATMGLQPQRHLGGCVNVLAPMLRRQAAACGWHPAGEGGEYETLVLNCPLFPRRRLEVQRLRTVIVSDDAYAGSGYAVVDVRVIDKTSAQQAESAALLQRLRDGLVAFPSDRMLLLRKLPRVEQLIRLLSGIAPLPGDSGGTDDVATVLAKHLVEANPQLQRCSLPPHSDEAEDVERVLSVLAECGIVAPTGHASGMPPPYLTVFVCTSERAVRACRLALEVACGNERSRQPTCGAVVRVAAPGDAVSVVSLGGAAWQVARVTSRGRSSWSAGHAMELFATCCSAQVMPAHHPPQALQRHLTTSGCVGRVPSHGQLATAQRDLPQLSRSGVLERGAAAIGLGDGELDALADFTAQLVHAVANAVASLLFNAHPPMAPKTVAAAPCTALEASCSDEDSNPNGPDPTDSQLLPCVSDATVYLVPRAKRFVPLVEPLLRWCLGCEERCPTTPPLVCTVISVDAVEEHAGPRLRSPVPIDGGPAPLRADRASVMVTLEIRERR